MAEREVTIKIEHRANGAYSLYVREGSFWNYTGLTFSALSKAKMMERRIRALWIGEDTT